MLFLNHLIDDSVVQDAAGWPHNEVIINCCVGGYDGKPVDFCTTLERRRVQRVFQRHYPSFLFRVLMHDYSPPSRLHEFKPTSQRL